MQGNAEGLLSITPDVIMNKGGPGAEKSSVKGEEASIMGRGASQGGQAASHLGATEGGARQTLTHRSQSPRRARQRAASTPKQQRLLFFVICIQSLVGQVYCT